MSLPTGFTIQPPAPAVHLALIMLAELLRDLSRPTSREDSDSVGADIRTILRSEGDAIWAKSLNHSKISRTKQVGRGAFSPLQAFEEAFKEWESRTGCFFQPALTPPSVVWETALAAPPDPTEHPIAA